MVLISAYGATLDTWCHVVHIFTIVDVVGIAHRAGNHCPVPRYTHPARPRHCQLPATPVAALLPIVSCFVAPKPAAPHFADGPGVTLDNMTGGSACCAVVHASGWGGRLRPATRGGGRSGGLPLVHVPVGVPLPVAVAHGWSGRAVKPWPRGQHVAAQPSVATAAAARHPVG